MSSQPNLLYILNFKNKTKHEKAVLYYFYYSKNKGEVNTRINPDNSGTIEYDSHRNENSYMQIAKEEYSKETIFRY
jgi:hypothetical protein